MKRLKTIAQAKAEVPTESEARKLLEDFKARYPELVPYAHGKEPTFCFFCVTCNALVPKEQAAEHAGHETEE